jgi:signal transduction histidine kinase
VLRTPLAAKLLGANALLLVGAGVVLAAARPAVAAGTLAVLGLALLASAAANVALVRLALRPLLDLEATAERVWRGDLAARVPRSAVADADVARVGRAFNLVLDGLVDDRVQLRRLAGDVVRAGDRERALIARELHDSAAQTLAAATYQLAALGRDAEEGVVGPELAERAAAARAMVAGVLEEVRLLAHTVYPRVLDDLGLAAALHTLADHAHQHAPDVDIEVIVDPAAEALAPDVVPPAAASALYRVAQESVTNALRHAHAHCLTVVLRATPAAGGAALTSRCRTTGAGFDVPDADARRPGMGLFVMRERVALAGGTVAVDSRPGDGTRVRATVPIDIADARAARPPSARRRARAPGPRPASETPA